MPVNVRSRNNEYTDLFQYCFTAPEGILFQFIYCLQYHEYSSSVPNLLVKLTASACTDRNGDSLITCFLIDYLLKLLNPKCASANLPCRQVTCRSGFSSYYYSYTFPL